MTTSCCGHPQMLYVLDGACADPFAVIPEWNQTHTGGYKAGEWVTYAGGWYLSVANNNTRNPYDRTVWSGPYTVLHLLKLFEQQVLHHHHCHIPSMEHDNG